MKFALYELMSMRLHKELISLTGRFHPSRLSYLFQSGQEIAEHRQCCSQPQSLCYKTSSAQQKWRQRGGACESVSRERKKGEGECCVCECSHEKKNRAWVLAE